MTIPKKTFVLVCMFFCAVLLFIGFFLYGLPIKTDADIEDGFPIDIEYEQRITEAESNFEICKINEEYSQQYKSIINIYYNQIMLIADDAFKLAFSEEQDAWEAYAQIYLDLQLSYYEQLYSGGSIVPVICSKEKYDLYRQRALLMRKMYGDLANVS